MEKKEKWRRKKERNKKGQKLQRTLTSGSLCVFNYQNAIGKKVMEPENTQVMLLEDMKHGQVLRVIISKKKLMCD